MSLVVALIGALISAACLYFFIRMEALSGLIDKVFNSKGIYLAALARLLVGAILLALASATRFPQAITLIGWLFAFAGLMLIAVPQPTLLKMVRWITALPKVYLRLWLVVGAVFGGFILCAGLV